MKEVSQETKNNVKEVLLQRDQERKEKLKSLKEEKELTSPDQIKLFHDTFEDHSQKILDSIKVIEHGEVDQKDLGELFSKINKDIQVLHRYLSVSTVFLTNYIVRKSLQRLEEIENKYKSLEGELLPKKRFGFKARKTKPLEKSEKKLDEVDSSSSKLISLPSVTCGFSDKKFEKLYLSNKEISKSDVDLRNLTSCSVFLSGNPSTIQISNVQKCTILCGPVSTSVFLENCEDCDLVVACQQLRIHSTTNSRLYIHVTSRAIIEDSSKLLFAPYNLVYEQIEEHFELSGLEQSRNNWNQVDDFNWLALDVPSPNWKELPEDDRVQVWPL